MAKKDSCFCLRFSFYFLYYFSKWYFVSINIMQSTTKTFTTKSTITTTSKTTTSKTKGQLLSDLLKQLSELISKNNESDGKNFKEWYSNWIVKTLSWRAPELMNMNFDDIEDRLQLICGQKEYYNDVISFFKKNKASYFLNVK